MSPARHLFRGGGQRPLSRLCIAMLLSFSGVSCWPPGASLRPSISGELRGFSFRYRQMDVVANETLPPCNTSLADSGTACAADQDLARNVSNASVLKLIAFGGGFGLVHVLTGPDHISAIVTLSVGGSCRAFWLGVRWGIGHSIGLLIMFAVFIASGDSLNLDKVEVYADSIVGTFMIALGLLGVWRAFHMDRIQESGSARELIDMSSPYDEFVDVEASPFAIDDSGADMDGGKSPTTSSGKKSPKRVSFQDQVGEGALVRLPTSPGDMRNARERERDEEADGLLEEVLGRGGGGAGTHNKLFGGASGPAAFVAVHMPAIKRRDGCCERLLGQFLGSAMTQRLVAMCVGIVSGIAGPGGILGVLPAVSLHDAVKSSSYLGSFCASSVLAMGVLAAVWGELTHRLGSTSRVKFMLMTLSSMVSVLVGCLWLVLLYTGELHEVLG